MQLSVVPEMSTDDGDIDSISNFMNYWEWLVSDTRIGP